MSLLPLSIIIMFCCIHQASHYPLGIGETCVTREGSSGECIVEFRCPTVKGADTDKLTVCANAFLFRVICCPSNTTHEHQSCGQKHIRGFLSRTLLIAGGRTVDKHSWPWMSAIYLNFGLGREFKCGGTIINERYVVTAAHCFPTRRSFRVSSDLYIVRLAVHNLGYTDHGIEYKVEKIIINEDFRVPAQYNDIALIKLSEKIKFSDKVQPICLPVNEIGEQSLEMKEATIIGWGSIRFGGADSVILREVNVPVTSNSYCHKSYSRLRINRHYPQGIISSIICAGLMQGGKDACQGDSGGPLMIKDKFEKWTLVGIVSGGFQCARSHSPGIYIRVAEYLTWIAENIN